VPAAYVRRVRWSGNFTAWVGLGITGLSSIIALPMFVHGKWQAYMPALFAVGGVALFAKAMRAANGRLRAYRIGKAVEGRVRQVRVDSAVLINGQQPYRVIYHYPVGARMEEGSVLSCDPMAMRRAAGQPIWVLYDEAAPEDHAIFPPLL
jgi:hypothetical protein